MANRLFNQFRSALEKSVIDIYCDVTFGATGAPTLVQAKSKGITSVVRISAGKYTITLMDKYVDLFGIDFIFLNATGIAAAPEMGVISNLVASTPPTIQVQFSNNAGAATDPASGDEVKMDIQLKNSTAY